MAKTTEKQSKMFGQRIIVEADIDILVVTCDEVYLATLFPNCNVIITVPGGQALKAVAKKGNLMKSFSHVSDSTSIWMIK
jgi:hypothetical protein